MSCLAEELLPVNGNGGSWRIAEDFGPAALQADGEPMPRSVNTASSIRRRSAACAGLDVSVKETSICVVDDAGKIVREVKVASEPEALLAVLKNLAYHFKRIGLEAGPLSQWLFSALAGAGIACDWRLETRHMQVVLKAQIRRTATMRAA